MKNRFGVKSCAGYKHDEKAFPILTTSKETEPEAGLRVTAKPHGYIEASKKPAMQAEEIVEAQEKAGWCYIRADKENVISYSGESPYLSEEDDDKMNINDRMNNAISKMKKVWDRRRFNNDMDQDSYVGDDGDSSGGEQ